MAIITYTSGTMTVGGETFDLADLGFEVVRYSPVKTRDNPCEVCGARDETWSDGTAIVESCAPFAHACERAVGVDRCMCGHRAIDHATTLAGEPICLLCAEIAEHCDRYRPSVKREKE